MKLFPKQQDTKQDRFTLPHNIWSHKFPPPAFTILAYLRYLDCHFTGIAPDAEQLAKQLRMSVEMAQTQTAELFARGLVREDMRPALADGSKNFFSLPNELFFLGLGHGAITVYAYLLYCEDRRTHQCHPSYKTISTATGLSVNTVMKHIAKLEEWQFIKVERTSYIDDHGMKWNGNNCYTILPIRQAVDCFHQRQMARLDQVTERQRTAKLLAKRETPA